MYWFLDNLILSIKKLFIFLEEEGVDIVNGLFC